MYPSSGFWGLGKIKIKNHGFLVRVALQGFWREFRYRNHPSVNPRVKLSSDTPQRVATAVPRTGLTGKCGLRFAHRFHLFPQIGQHLGVTDSSSRNQGGSLEKKACCACGI